MKFEEVQLTERDIILRDNFVNILSGYCTDILALTNLVTMALMIRRGNDECRKMIVRPPELLDGQWWFIESALILLMNDQY